MVSKPMFAPFDHASGQHVSWVSHMDDCARVRHVTSVASCASRSVRGDTLPDVLEQTREQADLPTEQPAPSQGARIPTADAYARRPCDRLGAPPQGPQRPDCLRR